MYVGDISKANCAQMPVVSPRYESGIYLIFKVDEGMYGFLREFKGRFEISAVDVESLQIVIHHCDAEMLSSLVHLDPELLAQYGIKRVWC